MFGFSLCAKIGLFSSRVRISGASSLCSWPRFTSRSVIARISDQVIFYNLLNFHVIGSVFAFPIGSSTLELLHEPLPSNFTISKLDPVVLSWKNYGFAFSLLTTEEALENCSCFSWHFLSISEHGSLCYQTNQDCFAILSLESNNIVILWV